MRETLVTAPEVEPVTLDTLKTHLRIGSDDTEHALIALMGRAARQHAESYCHSAFITQRWALVLDRFPGHVVHLPRGPVQSIDSIVYLDMGGNEQTITAPARPDFAIDLSDGCARIAPGFGRTWPETLPELGAVRINFTAGYGDDADDVPEGIRHWIMLRVNTVFENREEAAVMQRGSVSALPHVDRLLDPYRFIAV
jgi:uncharacterized phiE125 gp8 family phage protein